MKTQYLSCADTAKLIRSALKRGFPGVKFSVKSHDYSGGASIKIDWTDGPTTEMVDAVAKQFQGHRFDGTIDLGYSISHWMAPDGSVTIATNPGTQASGGNDRAERNWMPHPEAQFVNFGADHVFTRRREADEGRMSP